MSPGWITWDGADVMRKGKHEEPVEQQIMDAALMHVHLQKRHVRVLSHEMLLCWRRCMGGLCLQHSSSCCQLAF